VFHVCLLPRAVPVTPGERLGASTEQPSRDVQPSRGLAALGFPVLAHEATYRFAARYGPRLRSRQSADRPAFWSCFCWTSHDVTQRTALFHCSVIHGSGLLSSHKTHTAFTAHPNRADARMSVPYSHKTARDNPD
jgi:hypothetical protein